MAQDPHLWVGAVVIGGGLALFFGGAWTIYGIDQLLKRRRAPRRSGAGQS